MRAPSSEDLAAAAVLYAIVILVAGLVYELAAAAIRRWLRW